MNVLVILAVILLILMVLVGGEKGLISFFSLFLNFGMVMITIYFMLYPHLNPIIITMITCTVISCFNLFCINQVNRKTTAAFLSTLITIVTLLLFIDKVTNITMIQGFIEDQFEELTPFPRYVGVDFVQIEASVIIMSTIGAITDIAITISSSMGEILKHHPFIGRKELFLSGLNLGKNILGTETNTLFFAFYGGSMALLVWYKHFSYSVGEIVNSKLFCAEMISIFCAGIGIALIIPIASWINAYFSGNAREEISDKMLK